MSADRKLTRSQIAQDWVRQHSQSRGTNRLILLIFAYYVNDETGLSYPSVPTIMREAGVGRRRVFEAIKSLEELSELNKVCRRFNQSSQYEIIGPPLERSAHGGPLLASPETSAETDERSAQIGERSADGGPLPLKTSKETSKSTSGDDEIEAGLTMAAQRKVEEKILSGTIIRNPAGYQRTTNENLREEWAEVIEHARSEGWSRDELADKIAPAPYIEPVPKGAGKDPGVMYCDDYSGSDNGHHCYLTECPPESGHRFVKTRWQDAPEGYQTYGGHTFTGYRLWDPERDGDEIVVSLAHEAVDLSDAVRKAEAR